MSNSKLDDYLNVLSSVILSRRGATLVEILKDFTKFNGKECDVTQFGFPDLQTLLKSYPDMFHYEGNWWFAKVTEKNEDIVRSMATEKTKEKGWDHARISIFQRLCGTSARFRKTLNGEPLLIGSDSEKKCGIQDNRPLLEIESERRCYKEPAKIGFGNKSFNHISSRLPSNSRVSTFSDGNVRMSDVGNPVLKSVTPLAFQDEQPSFANRGQHTPEREIEPNSFYNVAPPALEDGHLSFADQHRHTPNKEIIEEESDPELQLAQKIYDLVSDFHEKLSIRQIAERLDIRHKNGLIPNAQVAVVVKKFSNIFSLSAHSGDGVVEILNGARRPGSCADISMQDEEDNRSEKPEGIRSEGSYIGTARRYPIVHISPPSTAIRKPSYENPIWQGYEEEEELRNVRGMDATLGGPYLPNVLLNNVELGTIEISPYQLEEHRYSPITLLNDACLRRRNRFSFEPTKFENKNLCLPSHDKVILTCFITLNEFYVRSCYHELAYRQMLEDLRDDYQGALEESESQTWMKGDGAAVWHNGMWQRGVISTPLENYVSCTTVFLIDVGETVKVSSDLLVPLHDYYHQIAPFAICCSIGQFDIFDGKRFDFLQMCNEMVECFMEADRPELDVEVLDTIWDGKDMLQVRLTYFGSRLVCIPDYFIEQRLITLR